MEATHDIWRDIEDAKGSLHILVTVSGTTTDDSPSNLSLREENLEIEKEVWIERYVSRNLIIYFWEY